MELSTTTMAGSHGEEGDSRASLAGRESMSWLDLCARRWQTRLHDELGGAAAAAMKFTSASSLLAPSREREKRKHRRLDQLKVGARCPRMIAAASCCNHEAAMCPHAVEQC